MKTAVYLVPILSILVILLIRAELHRQKQQVYLLKPICTLIVIAMALLAWLEPIRNATYSWGVLVGLLLSFGGDVALMFQERRKAFMVGLGLFLLAHIAYTVVFIRLGSTSALDLVSGAVLLAIGVGFYRLIHGNLGKMKMPVIVYMLVISLMVNRAFATQGSVAFSTDQTLMIAVGSGLFYISDMILAANRFWKPWKYHRFSLAFYYCGQMLIALAGSFF